MNKFDEMRAAIEEAKTTMRAADNVAQAMANMLVGRLRKVGGGALRDLKRELRDYNTHTRQWRR